LSQKPVRLTLRNIALWGYHGTEAEEKTAGGPFQLTIEADCLSTRDPEEDLLSNRIDYANLAARAAAIFSEKRFELMEPLVERLARMLLAEFSEIKALKLTLKKLRPVMAHELESAEVSIERSR
jgi:dihydroneopterin aldolase